MIEICLFLWFYFDYIGFDFWRVIVSYDDQDVSIDNFLQDFGDYVIWDVDDYI